MFHRKTVFVVGAGAGRDYGFPIGTGLAEVIHQKSDIRFKSYQPAGSGDFDLYENVKKFRSPSEEVRRAFIRIRDGILQTNSIDDFLDLHQADDLMRMAGKSAIVRAILEKEGDSPLMPPRDGARFEVLPIKNTWAWKLVRMLGAGASKKNILENVTFISFNYDRCLEQVLWQGIRDLYSIPQDEMREVMEPLQIFHPYGSIGPLPVSGHPGHVPFGGDVYDDYLQLASANQRGKTDQGRNPR